MSDTQLYPQIFFLPGLLQAPREERLCTCFPTEEGMKSRLSKYFRPRDDRPASRPRKPAPPTDAIKKLTSVWTTRYGCIIERSNMDTKLTRICVGTRITGSEKSKHCAVSGISHVIGAVSRGKDQLRTCTETKQTARLSKQASVDADSAVGHSIGSGSEGDRRSGELV